MLRQTARSLICKFDPAFWLKASNAAAYSNTATSYTLRARRQLRLCNKCLMLEQSVIALASLMAAWDLPQKIHPLSPYLTGITTKQEEEANSWAKSKMCKKTCRCAWPKLWASYDKNKCYVHDAWAYLASCPIMHCPFFHVELEHLQIMCSSRIHTSLTSLAQYIQTIH